MTEKLSARTELKRLSKVAKVNTISHGFYKTHTATVKNTTIEIIEAGTKVKRIRVDFPDGTFTYFNRVKFAIEATQ